MYYQFMLELWDTMELGVRWTESTEITIEIIMIAQGGPF